MKLYARFSVIGIPTINLSRYQSLELAGRQCGIRLPNAHRAVDDCSADAGITAPYGRKCIMIFMSTIDQDMILLVASLIR